MNKAVAPDADVNKGCLDSGLDVDNPSLVDIAEVFLFGCAFVIQLVEAAIFENTDADFCGLDRVDQDFPDNVRLPGDRLSPRVSGLSPPACALAS